MQDPAALPPAEPTKTQLLLDLAHTSPLLSCRFDPTGRYVFAGAQDRTIQRWDLANPTAPPVAFAGHESWVRALAFSPDGSKLYSGGYDGKLMVWPAAAETAPAAERTIDAHAGWIRALAISADGQTIASCGNDKLIKLWSAADGSLVREIAGHTSHVYAVAFHPNGQWLLSSDLKASIKRWTLSAGEPMGEIDASVLWKYDEGFRADYGGTYSLSFSPDGKFLATGGITNVSNAFAGVGNPMVVLVDLEKSEVVQKFVSSASVQGTAWSAVYHPAGFVIGSTGGQGGGWLFFWKAESDKEFHQFQLPNTAKDMDMHKDGLRLAVAHYDSHCRIYIMGDKPA